MAWISVTHSHSWSFVPTTKRVESCFQLPKATTESWQGREKMSLFTVKPDLIAQVVEKIRK